MLVLTLQNVSMVTRILDTVNQSSEKIEGRVKTRKRGSRAVDLAPIDQSKNRHRSVNSCLDLKHVQFNSSIQEL